MSTRTDVPLTRSTSSEETAEPAPLSRLDRGLGWTLLVTGLGAWLASAALVAERLNLYKDPGYVTSCDLNPLISCGTVMKSWQASLFGFPNPLIGLVGFAVVVAIGAALLARARFSRWFWISLQAGLLLCLVMLGWLFYSAVFVIGALCIYCMIVWFFSLPMFFSTLRRNLLTGALPAPEGVRRFFEHWTFVVSAVAELLVFGTVFVLFMDAFV